MASQRVSKQTAFADFYTSICFTYYCKWCFLWKCSLFTKIIMQRN